MGMLLGLPNCLAAVLENHHCWVALRQGAVEIAPQMRTWLTSSTLNCGKRRW